MAKFKFTAQKFESILEEYAEIREKTIPEAVHLNARLLCIELARRTQPFGDNLQSGTIRVEKDIGKVIKTPDAISKMVSFVKNKSLKKRLGEAVSAGDFTKMGFLLEILGFLKSWGGFENITSLQGLFYVHQNARNKTTGKTVGKQSKLYITSERNLDSYVTEVKKKVGMSKAGWAACALGLTKVNKGSLTQGFPPAVMDAMRRGSGDVQDYTNNLINPKVALTNKIPWVDRICSETEQSNAGAVVVVKMIKQMEMILKKRQKI